MEEKHFSRIFAQLKETIQLNSRNTSTVLSGHPSSNQRPLGLQSNAPPMSWNSTTIRLQQLLVELNFQKMYFLPVLVNGKKLQQLSL